MGTRATIHEPCRLESGRHHLRFSESPPENLREDFLPSFFQPQYLESQHWDGWHKGEWWMPRLEKAMKDAA